MSNKQSIPGYWDGEYYLLNRPMPLHNLTWSFIWSLVRLKLSSPRRDRFKLMIADYGYED
jgi:hypothetical protein